MMKCPECQSKHILKNGMRRGNQNHICVDCSRQFVKNPQSHRGYSDEVRKECLKMYVNGMGLRGIERVKGVHHTTIITWIKQVGELLHLLQSALVYVNTLMVQEVLSEPNWMEMMQSEDLRGLTPLFWSHVNPYGTFQLNLDERLPLLNII